mgnify:CR=1 FL=1
MDFVHLHVHTYYSILDGESSIKSLFKMADKYNQSALAITDHGNMFGVKDFLKVAEKFPNIKPIIGCEVYVNPEGQGGPGSLSPYPACQESGGLL